MSRLSVNVNKLATLRNARGKNLPDVEQLAAVGEHGTEPDKCTHGSDERRHERNRNEVRGRHIEVIAPRHEIVSQLMAQENREQWE